MKKISIINRLSHYTIRRQLYIIYFPIIFLSTLIIGFLLVTESHQKLSESYKNLSALNAQRAKSIVFDTTSMVSKNAESLSRDTDLRAILSSNYNNPLDFQERIIAYTSIKQLASQETALKSLIVYTTNSSISDYQNFIFADDKITNQPWFKDAQKTPDTFWIVDENVKPNKSTVNRNLTLYKNIPLPLSEYQAVLEMKIDYNFLKNRLATNNYSIYLQLNQEPLFYSDNYKDLGSKVSYDAPTKKNFYHEECFYLDELVASNTLFLSNKTDYINIYSIDHTSSTILKSNLSKWIFILSLSLITTTIIIILFANFFSHRIQDLKKAVHHAAINDYDYLIKDSGNDEISDIFLDFHTVIKNIIEKDEAFLEAKIAEKEFLNIQQQMEFKLLANQINPHFLYNTLETIRMLALSQGNHDVDQAIQLLAKSMRYTLESSGINSTTLADELDYVKIYLNIQQLRFGERVNYSIQTEKNLAPESINILPLLIQPIVENAIEHGLESLNRKGYISILVQQPATNLLLIEVSDNGIGIKSEELTQLLLSLNTTSKEATKHIGLRNVNSRIKMYYGKHSGLTINSVYQEGTTVILKLQFPNRSRTLHTTLRKGTE